MIANSLEWKKTKLEDAPLEIIDGDRGTNYPKSDEFSDNDYCLFLNTSNVTSSGFNFSKCNFVSKERDEALRKGRLKKGDVILTTRGTVGNTAWVSEDVPYPIMRINSGMVILRTKPAELLPEFLCCFIKSIGFTDQVKTFSSGTAQPQLPITVLKKIKIPIPPLEEQKRIVEILDRAESLRAMRRQSIEQLNTLTQAIFVEMFGNPIENEKGWALEKLGQIASVERGKFTPRPRNDPSYYGGNFPFIQTGDISSSFGRLNTWSQTLNEKGIAVSRSFPIGSIVIAIVGANIGITAILDVEIYCPDSVVGIQVNTKKASIEYIERILRFWKHIFVAQAPETARANINLETLRPLEIPIPPIDLQQKFTQRVNAIEQLKTTHQKSLTELDALFASLQHRAFRGEL